MKLLLILSFLLTSKASFTQKFECILEQNDTASYTKVSIIQLMLNPKNYKGKWIEVEGIYSRGFEYSILEPQKSSNLDSIIHPIWIDFRGVHKCFNYQTTIDSMKVSIKGKLYLNNQGHLGGFKYAIKDIASINEL